MIYFFNSTINKDKIIHPISIYTNGGSNKALALAIIYFAKHRMFGSPNLLKL